MMRYYHHDEDYNVIFNVLSSSGLKWATQRDVHFPLSSLGTTGSAFAERPATLRL